MTNQKVDTKKYLKLLFSSPAVSAMGPAKLYALMQLVYGGNDKFLETTYAVLQDEAEQMNQITDRFEKVTAQIMDRFETEMAKTKNAYKKMKVSKNRVAAAGEETAETEAILQSLNK